MLEVGRDISSREPCLGRRCRPPLPGADEGNRQESLEASHTMACPRPPQGSGIPKEALSRSLSQLNIAQEEVGKTCKDEPELEANIHSIGRVEQTGDGTNVINLRCPEQNPY